MIKLTPAEREVLISLKLLRDENPNRGGFNLDEVYERRVTHFRREPSSSLRRMTHEFLYRLGGKVPALAVQDGDGWIITIGGTAVCMTQLKV